MLVSYSCSTLLSFYREKAMDLLESPVWLIKGHRPKHSTLNPEPWTQVSHRINIQAEGRAKDGSNLGYDSVTKKPKYDSRFKVQ